jgi:hypothetical protein
VESPFRRELLWKDLYRASHPDVFAAITKAVPGFDLGVPAMVRELSRIRTRVKESAGDMRSAITELDPKVGQALGVAPEPSPVHVLMVGAFTANSAVGALGEDVSVFHCVEWFQTVSGARSLVAHETAHAWHQLALRGAAQDAPGDDDLLWMIFSEGLATQTARTVVPNLAEVDYFWYGHPEMDSWGPWCQEHRSELLELLRGAIGDPAAAEAFFGAGRVAGHWRVGYHLADHLVAVMGIALPDLVTMSVDEARRAVLEALQRG